MSKRRTRAWTGGILAFISATLGQVAAVSINAATSDMDTRWPGYLDLIRQYPFPAAELITALVAVASVAVAVWPQGAPPDDPPPPPPIERESWIVERPAELGKMVGLSRPGRGRTVAITTALHGAGGFGKTTLALLLCADRLAFTTDAGQTNALATAPDGSWLATTGPDHEVRVWDTSTGNQIASLAGHVAPVHALSASGRADWLASADDEGLVRLWSTKDWRPGPAARIRFRPQAVAWSKDDCNLVVTSDHGAYVFRLL